MDVKVENKINSDEEQLVDGSGVSRRKKSQALDGKKASGGGGGSVGLLLRNCQVEKCRVDLSDAKHYHRRHKVCEVHAKAEVVVVAGTRQRFCQQCSRFTFCLISFRNILSTHLNCILWMCRFHEVSEFDEAKRSCRKRLAGHNERRRKNSINAGESNSNREVSNRKGGCKGIIEENATFKHFQIR